MSDYLVHGCQQLETLYTNFKPKTLNPEKDTLKHQLIRAILEGIKDLPVNDTAIYHRIAHKKTLPNNAWFLQFRRYNAKQNAFEEEFHSHFHDDFKKYLDHLKKVYGEG